MKRTTWNAVLDWTVVGILLCLIVLGLIAASRNK